MTILGQEYYTVREKNPGLEAGKGSRSIMNDDLDLVDFICRFDHNDRA
jgi:hypothetical protein